MNMIRVAVALTAVQLAATAALAAPAPAASADNCIDCHRKAVLPLDREHDYKQWEKSAHAKAGISCHNCHGGDPKLTGAEAHKGVLPSSDPASPIYFTKVPDTCGACHADELKAFKQSEHHKELMRSGKGPNCVTCHGSMANSVMTPQQMETTCSLCHRKPTGASSTLMAVNKASGAEKKYAGLAAASTDPMVKEKTDALAAERKALLQDWHTFKLADALKKAQALTKEAIAAVKALTAKKTGN